MTSTRAFSKIRAKVLSEEPTCRLRLPGCTGVSEEVDHIIPKSDRLDLDLVRSNLRGTCRSCNRRRGISIVGGDPKLPPALEFFNTST